MQFTDASGRVWQLRVSWQAVRKSAGAGVDLAKVEEHLGDFYRCGHKLVDALYAVCSFNNPPAVTLEQFEAGLTADVLEQAREALLEAVVDFFPKSRRELMKAGIDEIKTDWEKLQSQLPKSSIESPAKSE